MNKVDKYCIRNKRYILLMFVFTVGTSFFSSLLPYVTSKIVDNFFSFTVADAVKCGSIYVLAIVGILLFEYFNKVISYKIYYKITTEMQSNIMHGILQKTREQFSKNETDYYVSTITNDVETLYTDYYNNVFGLICSIIRAIVYSGFMILLDVRLAIVIIIVSVISCLIPQIAGEKLSRLRKNLSDENAIYLACLKDTMSNFDIVNNRTRDALKERHNAKCAKRGYTEYVYGKFNSFVQIFAGFTLYAINIVTFIVGLILIHSKLLSSGEFVGLLSFIDMIALPIRDMIYQLIGVRSATEIKEKIEYMLVEQFDVQKEAMQFVDKIQMNDIKYKQNSFELQISKLEIEKGKKVAIVGKSGSGKSTLLKMIAGLINQYKGEVLIDGIDVRSIDTSKILTYITQDTMLFSTNGYNNISVFESYDIEGIEEQAEKINARYLLDREMGERGSCISGGEKNKISILRALASQSEIILCDEMFSALDEKSKKEISTFLMTQKDKTIISVTHDLSEGLLLDYDEIIVIEQGQVFMKGNSQDMIEYFTTVEPAIKG